MLPTNLRRSINGIVILAQVAADHGMLPKPLLAGTGLQPADLAQPTTTVSFEQEFRIVRNLLAHCGDPAGLGLEAGRRYHFTSLASVGFALVSSPTLRSAFDIALRYASLNASLVRVVLDAPGADLRIGFRDADLPPDLRRFAVERTMAVAITIARGLLQRPLKPRSIHFGFPRPAGAAAYRRFAGVVPSFDEPKCLLVLPQEDVDAPLSQGNPLALRMAEDHCRQLLDAWRSRTGLAAQVRERIAAQPGQIADMPGVADALHMSTRTLRRRLQQEGTSYLALCDEVREALAERLLALPRLPVEQVAERLGYSDAAAFIHAFKRWKGATPHSYRQGLRAGGAESTG